MRYRSATVAGFHGLPRCPERLAKERLTPPSRTAAAADVQRDFLPGNVADGFIVSAMTALTHGQVSAAATAKADRLRALFESRIAVLDGAMGTMIQQHQLTEADFRGDRFKAHPHDLRGNNDLICLTRPDIIEEIHSQYFAAGPTWLKPTRSAPPPSRRPTTNSRRS